MTILIEISIHFICLLPTIFEVYDDRNGDKHSDSLDITIRGWNFLIYPLIAWAVIWVCFGYNPHSFIQIVILSVTMFTLLFDYIIAYVLYRRKVISDPRWWQKINKTSWPDNWTPWVEIGWQWRMIVKVLIFIGGEIIYWL